MANKVKKKQEKVLSPKVKEKIVLNDVKARKEANSSSCEENPTIINCDTPHGR